MADPAITIRGFTMVCMADSASDFMVEDFTAVGLAAVDFVAGQASVSDEASTAMDFTAAAASTVGASAATAGALAVLGSTAEDTVAASVAADLAQGGSAAVVLAVADSTAGDLAAAAFMAGVSAAVDDGKAALAIDTGKPLRLEHWRSVSRWVLAAAFLLVGAIHLGSPDTFLPIVPSWVPYPRETVLVTGVCELAGAIGLLTSRFRHIAGIMLALYAVCVFPANIKHALDHVPIGAAQLSWWYHGPRLAFQPVIVWWALFSADVMDWPFRRRAPAPSAPVLRSSAARRLHGR